MSVSYPNTNKVYVPKEKQKKTLNIKKSKLGANFENAINETNEFYLAKDIAIIHKKPTPIKIAKVDFPKRSGAKITEAFYKTPSTTDYNGLYKGRYIDFEAKSCQSPSFPFAHLYAHQISHLESIERHGGISFLLIEFSTPKEVYLLPTPLLLDVYRASLNGGRKSIPYSYFQEHAYLVPTGFQPRIDYLKVINQFILKES
jgi:recombination protein U